MQWLFNNINLKVKTGAEREILKTNFKNLSGLILWVFSYQTNETIPDINKDLTSIVLDLCVIIRIS